MTKKVTSDSDDKRSNQPAKTRKPRKPREAKLLESGAKNKQRCDFARHLAEHGDKARARREANYSNSPNEYVLACRLADEPDVKAALSYWSEKFTKKLDIRSEAILGEIHAIAFSDTTEVWDWDETRNVLVMKDVTKLPKRVKAAIKSISAVHRTYYDAGLEQEVTEVAYKVEMHPKWNALKHFSDIIERIKPTLQGNGGTEHKRQVVEVKVT